MICDRKPCPTRLAATAAAVAVFAAACGGEAGETARSGTPVVAVPLAPLAGLVRALAPPGAVDVVVLVPPGANPETYEPRLEDLRRSASALRYLAVGHPAFVFETTWLSGLLDGSDAERVDLFGDCPEMAEDYHVWLSPDCLGAAADRAAEALAGLAPGGEAEIEANLADFRRRLAAVDSTAAERLAPHRGGAFLVLHPAWGYLAREYGLTQLSVQSHGVEDPGAARLAELIAASREEGIRVVFVQPQFNPAPARLLAEEIDGELVTIDPLLEDPIRAIDEATAALAASFEAE